MFESIYNFDLWGLTQLNIKLASPFMDQFWLLITHLDRSPVVRFVILPLTMSVAIYKYKWRGLLPFLVLFVGVGLTDVIAYRGLKTLVERSRPFNNVEISDWVRHVGSAHGPSFPSNHAANCFAGATILAWYFRKYAKYFYTFAILVALSRVALGVHYPSDVIVGALLGISVGGLIRFSLLRPVSWLRVHRVVSKPNLDAESEDHNWRTRTRRTSYD